MKIIHIIIGLLLCSVAVAAETTQPFARQDTGIRAAIEWCKERGGELTWTQTQQFQFTSDLSIDKATLRGDTLTFICKVPTASGPPNWLLSWSRPLTRIDGTPLPVDQITGYEILNPLGSVMAFTSATTYRLNEAPIGFKVGIRTIAVGGLKSEIITVVLGG